MTEKVWQRPAFTRVTTTAIAWLIAFALVMALFTAGGTALQALPMAVKALIISGVLVTTMTNLVMPILNRRVHALTATLDRRFADGSTAHSR